MLRNGVVAVFVLLALAGPASGQRLPAGVRPVHYDLSFTVDLPGSRFDGSERIQIEVLRPTEAVVLHAVDLQFRSVAIVSGSSVQRAKVNVDRKAETATLMVSAPLAAGSAVVQIDFSGSLGSQLRGFYVSQRGNEQLAVTQFESTDARRAFPCFDEPELKATFAIALTIDRRDQAISNGSVIADAPGPGANQHTLTFSTTPRMSSYLVAMAVGPLECTGTVVAGIPVRTCAMPGKNPLTAIALEAAKELLPYYNAYFSIRYPFGKLDLVAVPDFDAGAMENTGAIFFRETEFLADDRTASLATRKNIASVVAHEIAHQWFGDLVTMRWWDDLWLNEGFATWMASRALRALKPDWNVSADEAKETEDAMAFDSRTTTRPIRPPSLAASDIEKTFDVIAYQKGASVLRMIEAYVGDEPFRRAINAYLEAHAFGNASSEDFWTTVTSATHKPVDRIMRSFVTEPGLPLLEVGASSCRNEPPVTVASIAQHRFDFDGSKGVGRWTVPLCDQSAETKDPGTCGPLDEPAQEVELAVGCQPWVFINRGGRGYFRTEYTPEGLRALAPHVEQALSAAERLTLLDDEWTIVRTGRHTAAEFLTLAAGYKSEAAADVLRTLAGHLEFIGEQLVPDRSRRAFESFVRSLFVSSLAGGAAGDSGDDAGRTREALSLRLLGGLGDEASVVERARAETDAALDGRSALDPVLAPAILRVAVQHGNSALYDRLLIAADRSSSAEERSAFLNATTEFTDAVVIERGLARTLSADVRSEDTGLYLARFMANPAARRRAWGFLTERWNEIEPRVFASASAPPVFAASLGNFCDAGTRDEIERFFAAHPLSRGTRALDQALDRIDGCIRLTERGGAAVGEWLDRQTR
jgi:aminopeptidase N